MSRSFGLRSSSCICLTSAIPSGGVGSANTASAFSALAFRIRSEKSLAPGAYSPWATMLYPASLPAAAKAAAISMPQSVFSWKTATRLGRSAAGIDVSMGTSCWAMSGDFQKGEKR